LQTTFLVLDGGEPGTTIQSYFGQNGFQLLGFSLTQNLFDQSVFTGLKAAKSTESFTNIEEAS
jgi:hypothetical protein